MRPTASRAATAARARWRCWGFVNRPVPSHSFRLSRWNTTWSESCDTSLYVEMYLIGLARFEGWATGCHPSRLADGSHLRMTGQSHRADLKDLAVVAGLSRYPKLPAAVEFRHDRHYRHNRLAPHVVEGRLDAFLFAEPDQIARSRERQF